MTKKRNSWQGRDNTEAREERTAVLSCFVDFVVTGGAAAVLDYAPRLSRISLTIPWFGSATCLLLLWCRDCFAAERERQRREGWDAWLAIGENVPHA